MKAVLLDTAATSGVALSGARQRPQVRIPAGHVTVCHGEDRSSYKDRKTIAAAMRAIYTSPSVETAELALADMDKTHGVQYPGGIDVWRHAWNEFIPFLEFPPELRKVVYTTNLIESINYQLRKITKTRGHFPSDDAAMKLLYLGIRNISTQRGGEAGTGTWGWKQCLNYLVRRFEGRLPLV
jgi:putative transposase